MPDPNHSVTFFRTFLNHAQKGNQGVLALPVSTQIKICSDEVTEPQSLS